MPWSPPDSWLLPKVSPPCRAGRTGLDAVLTVDRTRILPFACPKDSGPDVKPGYVGPLTRYFNARRLHQALSFCPWRVPHVGDGAKGVPPAAPRPPHGRDDDRDAAGPAVRVFVRGQLLAPRDQKGGGW